MQQRVLSTGLIFVHTEHRSLITQNNCQCKQDSKLLGRNTYETYFLFFLHAFFLPPVARLLCIESREIPAYDHSSFIFFLPKLRLIAKVILTKLIDLLPMVSGGGSYCSVEPQLPERRCKCKPCMANKVT